ncbi:uncharacterized protein CcaverHIS019_0107570 [Cutaneotrichosporon cavernicola]|uniref:Guanine nucleotide-binding protein-like 1 n=1 Tax=Cutaneotrichosporon cavernicola TaxID=279322 RepID=A0AA48KX95_9TREE|nr:uncharacterized protein CcaverHIS019_0107570 [Cutaneotrichosporon cavernicola]BEI88039.1 hypothetical protein CcaverHIS019_0107570 [Cutaneotrichosporon cavernicola]
MPRRRPFSAKQKKEQVQAKRALKRGEDIPTPTRRRPPSNSPRKVASRVALESRFVTLPPGFLDRTRDAAYADTLPRPLPPSASLFPLDLLTRPSNLSVPARPKFRYGQTKKEVERNEEGVFRKWLASTRAEVTEWMETSLEEGGEPRSPSWFETNLEVWRQLWRVVESSSILLLLIDSRAPPLHCPPSLRTYLRALKPRKEFVLVLTKADLVDSAALEGWRAWLKDWWGGEAQVVSVTSYDLGLMYADKRRHRPAIPSASRKALVDALREAHGRLLAPPEWARTDEKKLAVWRPSVRSVVDWDVLAAGPAPPARGNGRRGTPREGSEPEDAVEEEGEEEEEEEEHDKETDERPTRDPEVEPLTIGLIGQPNVGKSSLLNALLGTNRVRASKTPGKTKHFQTIFWASKQVKIVDCPGLVCPSPAPMELQAMAGILPISQIPSLPACTAFVARHMPLEDIFRVPRPKQEDDIDLRTWRGPRPTTPKKNAGWTAGEIMDARALDRGFLTAKGGRPDANRAANGMLRSVADGRVRWGFYPPGREGQAGVGVWLGGNPDLEALGDESESEEEEGGEREDEKESEARSEGDEDEESEDSFVKQNQRSFFAALSLDESEGSEGSESDVN